VRLRRFSKFLVVGAANTLLSLAVFNLLIAFTGSGAPAANAVAYAFGIANSYFWNRRWTFADRRHVPAARTFPRFVFTNLAGLGITTAVVAALEHISAGVPSVAALPRPLLLNVIEALAIMVGLAWNFTVSKHWAFGVEDRDGSGGVS